MRHLLLFTLLYPLAVFNPVLAENNTQPLLDKSYQEAQAGRFEEALKILHEALDQAPNSSLIHTRIGGVKVLRKEYSAGIKDFRKAIMLDQKNASAFVGMAVAYLHMGQYNLARAALDEAAKIDPSKQSEIDQVIAWIDQRAGGQSIPGH